jgi:hypothetical protein
MIVTGYTVTYLLLSILSLFICAVALVMGVNILIRWKPGVSTEGQYLLEKRGYLVITAIVLGTAVRLVMLPLWFLTLHSYIPSIPGAMCLAGVHLLRSPDSFIATGLKFFLPLLYIFWLVVNHIDRQTERQPLLTFKLKLLIPLAVVMALESCYDWRFIRAVEPRKVTCCTSLFDVPREEIPAVVTSNIWAWYILFLVLTLFLIVTAAVISSGKASVSRDGRQRISPSITVIAVTLIGLGDLIVFPLALHTKISPLFLHAPFHHCIFCVYQNIWDGALFSTLITAGIWISLIYVWVIYLGGKTALPPDILMHSVRKLARTAMILLSLGVLIIVIHTAVVL